MYSPLSAFGRMVAEKQNNMCTHLPAHVVLHVAVRDVEGPAHPLVRGHHPPQVTMGQEDQVGSCWVPFVAPGMRLDDQMVLGAPCRSPDTLDMLHTGVCALGRCCPSDRAASRRAGSSSSTGADTACRQGRSMPGIKLQAAKGVGHH